MSNSSSSSGTNNMLKNPPVLTRKQKALREAFQSANSVEEMLKLFKKMEACFPESEMAMECLILAHKFHSQGKSPQQVLFFGKKALSILIRNQDNNILCVQRFWRILIGAKNDSITECIHNRSSNFYIASLCNFLGAASLQLNRCEESLSYLNWADRNLTKLEKDGRCGGDCVLNMLHVTHTGLISVKIAMDRKEETVVHAKKMLEIKEKTLEECSIGIGNGNRIVADTYFLLGKFEESLPFYLKALGIYTKHLGGGDSEIAHVRKNLGTIYAELGEHDKALEQARLSLNGLAAEINVANMLLELGKNEEGIEAFKSLIQHAEAQGNHQVRTSSFIGMARGFCNLRKFSDAEKYMKMATDIFEKKKIRPSVVATAFEDMSRVYEEMEEYESAISNLRRALAIPQLPPENLFDCFARLFSLISLTGNFEKGIPYLEEAVERLKGKFGLEHCKLSFGYICLGLSYKSLGKLETAAEWFVHAKSVFDVSGGPYDLESLRTSQTLSMTYAEMERYDLAIEIQEKVVRGFKVLGPSEQKGLNGAVCLLKEMKELATCEGSEISKCGYSEDGKAVFSIAETEGSQEARAVSLMCKAMGFYNEDKFLSAKKCIEIAQKIFDKNEICPLVRATAFEDMSKVYEVMADYEAAISYLRRALVTPELPQDHRIVSCSRLLSLLSLTGKEKKGISYLEEALERLKHKFGPNHVQVGYGYTNLGTAYMNSGKTESAVKFMAYAKNIMDVSLGPQHLDSLQASLMLSKNYADMGRYDKAMEIQEKVVEDSKGLGQSEQEFKDEAVRMLKQMKEMTINEVAESPQEHA